ncbi:MAG: hypothetical protein ACK4U0_13610 [Mesorhizobium sp.]
MIAATPDLAFAVALGRERSREALKSAACPRASPKLRQAVLVLVEVVPAMCRQ